MRYLILLILWPCFVIGQTYTGGLSSMRSPHLLLTNQDVILGLDQIKVTYVFSNNANTDITETLVFTLPSKSEDNFKHFSVLVNQQVVTYEVTQHAISKDGHDISRELRAIGLPFNPIAAIHIIDASSNRDSIISKLRALKLLDPHEDIPTWTVKTYYFWQQVFPAKSKTQIEQIYKPAITTQIVKFNNFTALLKMPIKIAKKVFNVATTFSFNDDSAIETLQSNFEKYKPEITNFCPTKNDYQILLNAYKSNPNRKPQIEMKELNFAYNQDDLWANAISSFNLTIECPKNMHPLICWNGDLKHLPNNSLRFSAENYIPDSQISILFVEN